MDEDKPLIWIGSSKADISAFPEDVKLLMGFALRKAQKGQKDQRAKPLSGQGGAGVLEVLDDYDGDTYSGLHGQISGFRLRPARVPEEVEDREKDEQDRPGTD